MMNQENNKPILWRRLLPFAVVIIVAIALMLLMRMMRTEPKTIPPKVTGFLVETTQLEPTNLAIQVHSQGLLQPKRRIQLLAEVSGPVTAISEAFEVGGRFNAGDVLVQIETADYQVAVSRAEANVASAKAQLDLEQAKAEQAEKDWKSFGKESKPSDLRLNIPQLKGAKAGLAAAQADLQKAQRNLAKTTIKAPFNGTLLSKNVDKGQYVNVSGQLATIAGSQRAEIRLPLTATQLNQLSLKPQNLNQKPLAVSFSQVDGPVVASGRLVRLEPEKDAQTLVTYAVAEVNDPLSLGLGFNTFLNAAIKGPEYDNVFAVPSAWLLPEQRLPLLGSDQRLQIRPVKVIYQNNKMDYVQSGLSANDRIVTTPIQFPQTGMQLRLKESLKTKNPDTKSEKNMGKDLGKDTGDDLTTVTTDSEYE